MKKIFIIISIALLVWICAWYCIDLKPLPVEDKVRVVKIRMEKFMRLYVHSDGSVNFQEIPMDMFNANDAPVFLSEDATIAWSVGPDGVDDGGLIFYDPTNGISSRGDIIVRKQSK